MFFIPRPPYSISLAEKPTASSTPKICVASPVNNGFRLEMIFSNILCFPNLPSYVVAKKGHRNTVKGTSNLIFFHLEAKCISYSSVQQHFYHVQTNLIDVSSLNTSIVKYAIQTKVFCTE